jgi:hypothetical protein
MESQLTILACLACSLYMTGVIVVIHVVHYPLFDHVDAAAFPRYHTQHTRRMLPIVFAPMLIELLTSVVLVATPRAGVSRWLTWTGLAAAAVTWGVTAIASVPLHGRLAAGFDATSHRALVRTNRVRLIAWFVHSSVMLVMAAQAMH